MKSTGEVVALLTAIVDGKQIYSMEAARFYSRFKAEHPSCITLEYADNNMHPTDPYFKATLTGAGKNYLRQLEGALV